MKNWKKSVHTLDLNFLDRRAAIGAYLIPHSTGAALVECGPASTLHGLKEALALHGLDIQQVTHVLLTHIHLDHAGAAGHLARQGAQIYVHPAGAPHLNNPEKLLASARRIYGETMDSKWGQFLPVPAEKLTEVEDEGEVIIGDLRFMALHTPGHAGHHIAWLLDDLCFTGDIGGVRMPGAEYIRLPFVPPELNIEQWRASLARLQGIGFDCIAPTHFGIYADASDHLATARRILDETERWLEGIMPAAPAIEEMRVKFVEFQRAQARALGLDEEMLQTYEIANPTWMGADGLMRYWRKVRMGSAN